MRACIGWTEFKFMVRNNSLFVCHAFLLHFLGGFDYLLVTTEKKLKLSFFIISEGKSVDKECTMLNQKKKVEAGILSHLNLLSIFRSILGHYSLFFMESTL